jgi:PAS domain S-box-containing protein
MEKAPQSPSAQGPPRVEPAQNESGLFSGESVLNILKLIFAGAPLSEVLTIIARLVEAQGKGMLCTIWLLDKDGRHLRCATAPSLPAQYIALLDGTPVGPNGCNCGTAVYRKEPVYVTDILSDPLWDDYRHLALPYGLRACWSRPLVSSQGKVLGTFACYHREVRSPSPTEMLLIENAEHIAGIAIERHVNEEELRRSEARKTAILDSALDCIVTIDHEGCITEFNPAAERTFGFGRDEVVGKHLTDVIIPPSLRERHRRGFARYLATGEARVLGRRVEMTAARADGSEFPVELAITRIPLDGPPSFTGYLRDITERKQAEEKLRRSGAFLAQAQYLSRIGSFSWRVAIDEITWSEQLYLIFEFDQGVPVTLELIGTRVHPEDIPLLNDMIERVRGAVSDFEYEHRLLMPDHSVKYLHLTAHGSRDNDGRLEYIGAVQDVTQRRSSEEALSKARSELARVARVTSLGVLTASIAHEVNQPLSGIITNASTCLRMLAADPPNVEGARDTARRTIRDGNRASEVISRLRSLFSKKDASIESVDLNEATREVIALSLSKLHRNRVILRPELGDDLPLVTGDRVQLQQVILNLLGNASDAMSAVEDRPRQLLIRTERDESDGVRLTVQDAGVGIDPQGADRLFEAFYTTKNDGMGIGLSVSRSIIENHHGRLWAVPNDGPGATFSFSIPRGPEGVMGAHSPGAIRTPTATRAQAMRNL